MPQPCLRASIANTLGLPLALALALASPAIGAPVSNLDLPRESPIGKVSQQVGLTEIAVEYGSPAVKGRKIWGGVVPYDRLWSLGDTRPPPFGSPAT